MKVQKSGIYQHIVESFFLFGVGGLMLWDILLIRGRYDFVDYGYVNSFLILCVPMVLAFDSGEVNW